MNWQGGKTIRALACALALGTGLPAGAALPDPVAFGNAVDLGDTRTVTRWLDEGLDPEFQADRVGSGLMIAAWNGNIPMMELFLQRGANPRRANRNGEQALQLAAWNGHLDAVKWLLERGAALNREGDHWSALHYAIFNGHESVARYLIERGADVNARSPNKSTPLMMAAREGHERLARLLLEAGADPSPKNDWGDTAVAFAMRNDNLSLARLISSEEFAAQVRRPPESRPQPVARSVRAPSEIETILRELRQAEQEGRPTAELRQRLMTAVDRFRQPEPTAAPAAKGKPYPRPVPPKSLVVTARRGQPGSEKAEVVYAPQAPGGLNAPVRMPPRQGSSQVADLLRQIRQAEAEGRPSEALRQQLIDAVDKLPR